MEKEWVWLLVLDGPDEGVRPFLTKHYFDDNSGVPDGPLWLCESADVEREDLREIVNNDLGYVALGIRHKYDGSQEAWKMMHNGFCDTWCGYARRGVAYGIPSRKERR
jgi:hypothetical protein